MKKAASQPSIGPTIASWPGDQASTMVGKRTPSVLWWHGWCGPGARFKPGGEAEPWRTT